MASTERQAAAGQAADAPCTASAVASDQENADPADGGSLRKLWQQGTEGIATHRLDNLFQSLEERTLTDEEQRIIQQRVALQRKMFEEYERRERRRKVAELLEVCPDISPAEAEQALQLCNGREDDAAARLVSDAGFRRRIQIALGLVAAPPAAAAPPARKEPARQSSRHSKPAGPRPRLIDPASLKGNVFMGAFRGKGFKPPPKARSHGRRLGTAAATGRGGQQQQDEDTEEEEAGEAVGTGDEQTEAEEEEGEAQQPHSPPQQCIREPAAADEAMAEEQPGQAVELLDGVLLWPGALAAAAAEQAQRYVLVQADTLQAPPDSLLRSARRQLGEPSDSRLPCGVEGGSPASAARSRPASTSTEESPSAGPVTRSGAMPSDAVLTAMSTQLLKLDDSKAGALLRRMASDAVRAAVLERLGGVDAVRAAECWALLEDMAAAAEDDFEVADAVAVAAAQETAEQQQQQLGAPPQQQHAGEEAGPGAGGQPAAAPAAQRRAAGRLAAGGARQAGRRATPPPPSDSEQTESEASEPSSAGEAESSDDDFAAPPAARHSSRAPAQPARARPSRAAKQVAAATFVAFAADSAGAGSTDEEMEEAAAASSDEEPSRPASRRQRQRRSAGKPRGAGGRGKAASPSPSPSADASADAAAEQNPSSSRQALAKRQRVDAALDGEAAATLPSRAALGAAGSDAPPNPQQAAACSGDGGGEAAPEQQQQTAALPRVRAISSTGHTCRGRVKQKSHKSADLVVAGTLRAEKGWYNAGYIFPEGFQSRTLFRSSVAIDQLCVHECHIMGRGGAYWPQPTFKVVALDRPDEPLIAKSCTGCWTGILKRINAEIEARRRAGEDLPPPPKTAIAGPEYFGLNQPNIQSAVEGLDPDCLCTEYWAGKRERQRAAAGLPAPAAAPARAARPPRAPSNGGGKRPGGGGGKRGRRRDGSDSEGEGDGEAEGVDDETQFMTNKWSAVSRAERYRNRLEEMGEDTSQLDRDNPLPAFIDPITMSAVVRPAISPHGYVAGLATWKVVLAEKQQCPFTNQPLSFEQLKLLSKTNIHLHRDKIVNGHQK